MPDSTPTESSPAGASPAPATLFVPDDTSDQALIELVDALNEAGFEVTARDGFDARDAVGFDLTRGERGDTVTVPDPESCTDYEKTYQHARSEVLAGREYNRALKILGHRMGAAVQQILDAQAADPAYDDPDRQAVIDAMTIAEEEVTTAMLDLAWDTVEVPR